MEEELMTFELHEEGKPYNIRHRSYYFSKAVIEFVKDVRCDRIFSSLYDQLVRSSTSIGANLVEARAGSSKKDWKKFYVIALKSANETKYWLCLIRDTMEVSHKNVQELLQEADAISKIIAAIILNDKDS